MECFTADFLQFFAKERQKLTFKWAAGYSPLTPSISGIFLKFFNLLKLGNSYIHFLLIIIQFCFACGEDKKRKSLQTFCSRLQLYRCLEIYNLSQFHILTFQNSPMENNVHVNGKHISHKLEESILYKMAVNPDPGLL